MCLWSDAYLRSLFISTISMLGNISTSFLHDPQFTYIFVARKFAWLYVFVDDIKGSNKTVNHFLSNLKSLNAVIVHTLEIKCASARYFFAGIKYHPSKHSRILKVKYLSQRGILRMQLLNFCCDNSDVSVSLVVFYFTVGKVWRSFENNNGGY